MAADTLPVADQAKETAMHMVARHGSKTKAREWARLHAQSYERLESGYLYWNKVVDLIDAMEFKS